MSNSFEFRSHQLSYFVIRGLNMNSLRANIAVFTGIASVSKGIFNNLS